MGARTVDGRRHSGIPGQVRTELVLIGRGDHVGRVVVGSKDALAVTWEQEAARTGIGRQRSGVVLSGITRGLERMRPTEADAVCRRQFLGQEQPCAVALTLVL